MFCPSVSGAFLSIFFIFSGCFCHKECKGDISTLQLVHVLFRHGERTVDSATLYPNDPYINETYFPYGVGQLTLEGKRREYRLGKALRQRYDTFLGDLYTPDILDAWTTDFNRTKMSLELVLAGLFPPVEDQIIYPNLNWQPIPYNYVSRNQDKILLGFLCPNYKKYYDEYLESPRIEKLLSNYDDLFEYLSDKSGWTIRNFGDIFYLYFGLRSEAEWGFELPSWADKVYPQPMENLVIREYFIATGTVHLRRLAAGYFIEKILEDSKAKISGILKPADRKIFLYSGHESNIAFLLSTLDIFEPKIPPYGCYILIELHLIEGVYGFKIFFEDYLGDGPKLLRLPGCQEFCPIDKFISLVEEYLPEPNMCGN